MVDCKPSLNPVFVDFLFITKKENCLDYKIFPIGNKQENMMKGNKNKLIYQKFNSDKKNPKKYFFSRQLEFSD